MKKKEKQKTYQWKHVHDKKRAVRWLPVHSKFYTPFMKFGEVKGIERLFLEVEITLSLLIVLGSLILAVLKVLALVIK